MFLLWGIGDVVKHYPRVVKFILNNTISRWPLRPPLGCAEVDVPVDLLLLNIGHERKDVAVTVSIHWINIPNPLINVVQWSELLVSLH